METSSSDHVCPGQIDHYKQMIIITNYFSFFFISHADYHLIDINLYIYYMNIK